MNLEQRLEAVHRPKEVLDLRGLLMHSYHGAHDPNAFLGSDGHSLIKRAGHGLEAFWERYLRPIFERTAPIDVVAVKEGGNNIRSAIYPEYKAKRKAEKDKQDPRLTEQLELLQREAERLLTYLGCTLIEVPQVEADDVIGMICHRYPGPVVVHTRDVDLAQLAVLPNVTVMLAEQIVDPDEPLQVKEGDKTIQLYPRHVALYKSLVGDKSDEYKGVPQIGPAAWEYLVATYGDEGLAEFEKAVLNDDPTEVIDTANTYGDKVVRKMADHWDQWRMCYRLATLHPSWCWMARGGKLLRPRYEKRLPLAEKVIQILDKLGIGALYEDLKPYLSTETLVDANWLSPARMERIQAQIEESPALGFDTEGYDSLRHEAFQEAAGKGNDYVDTLSQKLTGGSFTFGRNLQHTIYVPTLHRDTANLPVETLGQILRFTREKAGKLIVAHNARFEQGIVERELGLDLPDMEDTMTWLSYFDESMMEGANGGGNLKEASLHLLRHEQVKYEDVLAMAGAEDMRGVTGEQVLHYGCDDALTSSHLWVLMTFAVALEQQSRFVEEFDILTGKALNRSYREGVAIDFEEAERQRTEDKEAVAAGMTSIRAALEERCTEIDEEDVAQRALALLEADRDFLEMSLRQKYDGIGSEKLKAEMLTKLYKYREACAYTPFEQSRRPVEFVPTKLQILEVARLLGLPAGEEYEMASVAGARLIDWMVTLADLVSAGHRFDPRMEQFMQLLGAASLEISKRSGEAYQAFYDFCQQVVSENAPLQWKGDELNFDSPVQMTELLYLKLGLPVRVRSKVTRGSTRDKWRLKGSPATNEKAMQMAIAEDAPEGDWKRDLLKTLISVKAALTREELYWRPYPLWARPDTGCVHGGIKNNGTVTRRPTGSSPNLLQVSKGPVRRVVIPRYNRHVVVSIDFSGQELRITGSEAKDPSFIEAYTGGGSYVDEFGMTRQIVKDVHSVTGCMFALEVLRRELDSSLLDVLELDEFGKMSYFQFRAIVADGVLALSQLDLSESDAKKIDKAVNKVRKMAKAVNFLICYLGQPSTLAGNIGIPKAFAEQIMAAVFKSYARLAPWQEETIAFARKNGYVTTAFGTWKHVSEDILSKDGGKRSRAERQAVNQTIQGCAADILKVVLTHAEQQGIFHNPQKAVMYAPVYDEIVASVHMDYCFEYVEKMQDIMNLTPPGHAIPMMGEVSIGLNWCDQTELGDRPAERKIINLFESWVKEAA